MNILNMVSSLHLQMAEAARELEELRRKYASVCEENLQLKTDKQALEMQIQRGLAPLVPALFAQGQTIVQQGSQIDQLRHAALQSEVITISSRVDELKAQHANEKAALEYKILKLTEDNHQLTEQISVLTDQLSQQAKQLSQQAIDINKLQKDMIVLMDERDAARAERDHFATKLKIRELINVMFKHIKTVSSGQCGDLTSLPEMQKVEPSLAQQGFLDWIKSIQDCVNLTQAHQWTDKAFTQLKCTKAEAEMLVRNCTKLDVSNDKPHAFALIAFLDANQKFFPP
jgi:regulator of replication initiation timing